MNYRYKSPYQAKKKPKTDTQKAEADLWKWFSLFIRLRDSDKKGYLKCFTCGAIKYFRQADAGHGIPRQHKATKYDERNVHGQCKACNGFNQGMQAEYANNVDAKYGKGTWDTLQVKSRQVCKRGVFEYESMTNYYQNEAERIANEKGIAI